VVNGAVSKLVLGPTVLGEWGKERVELSLSKIDNGGSGFFSKLLKVKLGSSTESFNGRCGSGWGWGADNVWVGINGGGLESVRVDKGDTSAGQ